MLHSKFPSILLTLFVVISCHKKDSDKPQPQGDLVRSILTTSAAAYDNATTDNWVNVTPAEYNKLLTQVTQAVTCGATELFMNTTPAGSWANDVTAGGNDLVAKVPASSYIIGWSIKTGVFASTSSKSNLKVSISQKTGYTTYGKQLPDIGSIPASTRVYFVLKQPSSTTPASPCYTAVYNYYTQFLGTSIGGGPEFAVFSESSSLGTGPGYSFDSYSQVISTIKKPY